MATMIVVGRLGKDADLRELQNNTQVCSFSVADDVGYGDKKTTNWIKCAFFGKRAAAVSPHMLKGGLVEVIGTPNIETWANKSDGAPRATITLNVQEVRLHGGTKPSAQAPTGRVAAPQPDESDEVPF